METATAQPKAFPCECGITFKNDARGQIFVVSPRTGRTALLWHRNHEELPAALYTKISTAKGTAQLTTSDLATVWGIVKAQDNQMANTFTFAKRRPRR